MRPGATPLVQDFKLFHQSTLACLDDQPSGTFAGSSKYGSICWVAKGAQLEVLELATHNRLGSWQFGRVLGDQHTTITCVKELHVKNGTSWKLLVGISNSSPNGLLCVFDLNRKMIEKCIEIPYPVTAVEIICTSMGDSIPRWALSEQLRYYCGIVAVGCSSGHAFLIDLRLDDRKGTSSEEEPSKLQFISPRNRDVENQRLQCLMKDLHLCIPINESLFTTNGFEYQKPDGVVMKTFRPDMVNVTCLTYIQQTGILAIGYSFGCYQLWKLQVPVLEYSSRLESEPMPVTHITHQEPENDPKNFCYLWIARSQLDPEEEYGSIVASIALYQLSFGRKTYYNSYGVFYEELTSICLRLDHELTPQPIQYGTNYNGMSRLLECYTLSNPYYQLPTRLTEDSFDESNHGPDLSLCVFVWEATEGTSSKIGRHLAIFDINRWYHAQMPSTIRYVSTSVETCSYMCFYKLLEGKESVGENLLAVHIEADKIQKFYSNSPLPPEQHFYPSSLEFDATMIFDSGTMKTKFLGDQGQVLSSLRNKGPIVLLHPQELYNMCVYVGLLPRPTEGSLTQINMDNQREALLSLALDYKILSTFKACITEWASGEYLQQGCSLKFLLDWAWQKVASIKDQIDTTCVNLYNWSGLILDQRGCNTLYLCEQRLAHLVSIFKLFTSQAVPITEQGEFEIQSKMFVSSMISQHLSMVLWFVFVGLLPENDDTEVMKGFSYAYPMTSLISAYKARRHELENSGTELMIDGLVESSDGVADLWEREGGNGRYPPPSLHALLSTYLLENVDMQTKHSLTLYLLLDLVSMETPADKVTISDKVVGFTRRYNLSQTLVKQVQAFWQLDHKDFEEAVVLLETQSSGLTSTLSHWQHRCILKALFYQSEVKIALRYLYIANPPLYSLEDIKLKLTVLLANGFVAEALQFQRRSSSKANMKDLLTHVFHGCQQTKTIDRLLPGLGCDEEKMLEEYLESCDPLSMDLLVMHYLQSSRIVEAFQLNEKLKQYTLIEASPKARERAAARNAIVDKYIAIYPDIQRKLLFEKIHVPKRNTQWRRVVNRPTPLSTRVTKSKASVMTMSSYVMKIMENIDEMENLEDQSPDRSLNQSVGPFLCTPVIPSRKSFIQSPTSVFMDTENEQMTPFKKLQKSFMEDQCTPTSGEKRRSKFFSASCLTLLQTPKVKKVTPEKQRKSVSSVITPQSILKVRSLVSITSPSPHSAGSSPSPLDTSASGRKMARRLGYSSQTGTPKSVGIVDPALSGIPRHLAMEVQTASAPTTPKSVSFKEPSTPTDELPATAITPKMKTTSQPGTPKSVSFSASFSSKSFMSASMLKPLVTPTTPAPAEKKTTLRSPPLTPRQSPTDASPPKSPRSLRERSPTPESSQHSPKFAQQIDELCRRPLHDTSPTSDTSPISDTQSESLHLKLEESDENISDDNMETEETGRKAANSPQLDSSVTSTMSGESVIHVTTRTSPKQTTSPKINIKHATDKITVDHSATESVTIDDSSPCKTERASAVEVEAMEMEVDTGGIELKSTKEIFGTDEEIAGSSDEMTASSNDDAGSPGEEDDRLEQVTSSNGLIKESGASIAVKVEVEEMVDTGTVQSSPEVKKGQDSPISSGYDVTTTSPSIGTSDRLEEKFLNDIDMVFGESPDGGRVKEEPIPGRSGIQAKKTRITGKFKLDIDIGSAKQETEEIESETETKRARTPTRSSNRQTEPGTSAGDIEEPVTPTRSSRRSVKPVTPTRSSKRSTHKGEELVVISAVSPKGFSKEAKEAVQESLISLSKEIKGETSENEIQEPLTPTRSSRRSKRDSGKPVTPTRSSKRSTQKEDELVVLSAVSPKGFSTQAKKAIQKSLLSFSKEIKGETSDDEVQEPLTPTRSSRRSKKDVGGPLTPTRSSKRSTQKGEELMVISAVSPKGFSKHAKEAVQESLISMSAEMKSTNEASPSGMTKIRDKSDYLDSPSRTPTRSSRKKDQGEDLEPKKTTPSRSKKGKKPVVETESDDNENPVTPTRGRKKAGTSSETNSPARQTKSPARNKNNSNEKVQTPTRRQRKKETDNVTVLESEEHRNETLDIVQSEMDIGHSDILNDIPASAPGTPSRRASLGRSCKPPSIDITEDVQAAPSDGESIGKQAAHSGRESIGKQSEIPEDYIENEDSSKSPSRRKSLSRTSKDMAEVALLSLTPTRRRSLGRSTKKPVLDKSPEQVSLTTDHMDQSEAKKTPTRRGRPKKVVDENVKDSSNETEAVVKTPTRRGRPKKAETVTEEKEDSEKAKSPVITPSRRKRVKKEEKEEKTDTSPARHTRSHDDQAQAPEIYDIQSSSFQFSNPTLEMDHLDESQAARSFAPTKSFIFSPPIHHTSSRLVEQKDQVEEKPTVDQSDMPKEVTKKTSKRRTKKLYKESEEILLISPVAKEDSDVDAEGLSVVTRTSRAGRKKAQEKDNTKANVQNILSGIGGKRPRRTSYRIGPLGKKK